jgi:NhaA family Na+:H+ antiporter
MLRKINLQTFKEFLRSGQIGGVILLISVVISLLIANSSLYEGFASMLHYEIGFNTSNIELRYSTQLWINDGLMAIFFLLVGLEIKREIIEGELSSVKKAAMPVFAALGGMLVPALIYFLINKGTPTASGWGIPMATDIAFALAVISMLGKSVPASLKIFLAALAIVDDLGAILVIAIFYTGNVHLDQLLYSAGILALLVLFNRFGVKNLIFYLIPGLFLWYFIHHSGIHATIAGVLLAFTIPTNTTAEWSPLEKLEHSLAKPVNMVIMPVFALANTLIHFESGMVEGLGSSLGLGIITGLLVGKTVGIFSFSWLSVKLKWSQLPSGAGWSHIFGLGMLGGIGFTMSVFIALLSFDDPLLQSEAKFSILVASFFAGIGGYLVLLTINKRKRTKA